MIYSPRLFSFFFFNDTATTEIYTLSLHDALPISPSRWMGPAPPATILAPLVVASVCPTSSVKTLSRNFRSPSRSEEHTSELQSHLNLVCRLLLEKKK